MSSVTDEIYPNSPLVEVIFEIRFPGELQIECERHLFWERIRKEYPTIKVPHLKPEKAPALLPYKFDRKDGEMTAMIALNSFALSALKYPGFKEFKKEYLRLYKIFGEVFKIGRLNRAGWRYVNIIPFVREQGSIPLNHFLNLGFKLPECIPERFQTVGLEFVSRLEGATVTTKLNTLINDDTKQEALLLDFDYAIESSATNLELSNVENYMDEAHKFTRQLFEDLVTDEYRQYLKGDTL